MKKYWPLLEYAGVPAGPEGTTAGEGDFLLATATIAGYFKDLGYGSAEDAVDAATTQRGLTCGPCRTRDLPLVGAASRGRLARLEAHGVRAAFLEAVEAATRRSEEIGRPDR